ncbi:F-box/kelch-repeat protein At3g23880-like [Hibiscus syriacus]|uniref:F-box/kelch-repeat protein At3g23880-like n=1 Tax=Hibiscus syriacus TaxID=106335 RepID=UPI00192058A0|nr:F-box/kelch-repeat protein At3g23880-like [Hibiscus syriacus]
MLALENLSKLPVKSLTRFRLVCKAWSSSFHTPLFITKHHQNSLNLLLKRSNGNARDDIFYISQFSTEKYKNFSVNHNIHVPIFDDYCLYVPEVYGPCNKLLCVSEKCSLEPIYLRVQNPSSVQRPPNLDYTGFNFCFIFGYDPPTEDYKVVRFVAYYVLDDEYESKKQVELYSLKNDSWKEIIVPGEGPRGGTMFNACLNGFCY